MGAAASTRRRATLNTFTLRASPNKNDFDQSTINQAIDARAVSAPPPLISDVRIPCAGGVAPEGESLPEHASAGAQGEPPKKTNYSVGTQAQSRNKYDGGNDSTANTDIRRNEFHTLQDEMHQKRAVGMSYNDIFNEMSAQAAQAKAEEAAQNGGRNQSRRATVDEHGRDPSNAAANKAPTPVGSMFRRFTGKGRERYDSEGDSDSPRRNSKADEKQPASQPSEGSRRLLGSTEDNGRGQAAGNTECSTPVYNGLPSDGDGPDDMSMSSYNNRSPGASSQKPLRRAVIFDKGVDASTMQGMLNDDVDSDDGAKGAATGGSVLEKKRALMGEEAADIVIGALQKFFFLDSGPEETTEGQSGEGRNGEVSKGMAMLMRAMEREEHEAGTSLMEQGEQGQYMFIVEEGSLEVIIDGEAIRVIGVGDRVGELALLYNAPRSASVRTLSPCVLWSIHREEFKAVQALTASGNLIARSTHLYHVPWLRLLGTTDLSKLAACCRMQQYKNGDVILTEGEETDRCFLIESGEVVCSTHEGSQESTQRGPTSEANDTGDGTDAVGKGDVCERVERLMMVARPEWRPHSTSPATGIPEAAPPLPAKPPMPTNGLGGGGGVGSRHGSEGNFAGITGRAGLTSMSKGQGRLSMGGVNGMGASRKECQPHWDEARGQVIFGKGCFLGVPVLLASAELEIDGLPGWELATSCPRQGDGEAAAAAEGSTSLAFAALSPVQIVAKGEVRIGHFDVARFAKTVGAFAKVLGKMGDGRRTSALGNVRCRQSQSRHSLLGSPGGGLALKYEKLTVHSFERMEFLGQGSFGHVTMVRKKEGVMGGALFALKSLSKEAVVEGGQVHHLKDEKNVLEMFNHPFILRLYTTFQDANRVFFLTELLTGGELWSIIYESASGFAAGLPPDHVTFYSAVVVDALAYMHKKGIAYRDLKPENLIVDDVGYLRIIDMGFAKQIPFFVSIGGGTQMHPRSHTMCGTPEYLAPEFIFNKGHDKSADLWALGVLIFELVEARTPFAPIGAEQDIAQLFTNIACVKKRGVEFPEKFDEKSGGPHCRTLISGILEFEPGDRLGNLANGMNDIKEHAEFEGLDWEALESKHVAAPWVPEGPAPHPEPDSIASAHDIYRGDQGYFAEF